MLALCLMLLTTYYSSGCCRHCSCIHSGSFCFNCLLLIVRTVRNPRWTLFISLPWISFSMTLMPHLFQKMSPNFAVSQMGQLQWMIQFLNLLNLIHPYWVLLGHQEAPALCRVVTHLALIWIKFTMRLCTGGEVFVFTTGRARLIFVSELSHLFNAYYPGSSLERIALKAAMSLLILILQKPFYKSNLMITLSVMREDSSCGCVDVWLHCWRSPLYSTWIDMSLHS